MLDQTVAGVEDLIQPGDGQGFPTTVKKSNGVGDSWKE